MPPGDYRVRYVPGVLAREDAEKLDAADPLAGFRDRFALDDPSLVYLNGNSLGALPRATLRRLEAVIREEWGTALARSWDHWVDLPARAGDMVGELTGAAPGQVLVADNTTVNLYKLACAALDARPGRHVIVTDRDNFPSDRYVLEGIAAQRGAELRMLATDIDEGLDPGQVRAAVDEDTALVSLSHVAYRSGALADMAAVTEIVAPGRRADALGSVPLGRRGARRARPLRRGPGGRLHLQVPQRGSGRARVPLRLGPAARGAAAADLGLVLPARPVRHGTQVRPGAGHRQVHDRHPVHPGHRRGGGGRAAAARGGPAPDARQEPAADQLPHRAGRRLAGAARLRPGHAAGRQPPRRPRHLPPPAGRTDRRSCSPRRTSSPTTARRSGSGSACPRSPPASPTSGPPSPPPATSSRPSGARNHG